MNVERLPQAELTLPDLRATSSEYQIIVGHYGEFCDRYGYNGGFIKTGISDMWPCAVIFQGERKLWEKRTVGRFLFWRTCMRWKAKRWLKNHLKGHNLHTFKVTVDHDA